MTIHATDPRSGLFRFLHHTTPLEWTSNVDERLEDIRTRKPAEEIAGRLAAILRVPDALVPSSVSEAWRASEEAWRASEEAWRAYEEARRAYGEAKRAYEEAWRADEEAWRAYEEVRRADKEALASAFPDPLAFALSLGPLPEGVTWHDGALRFNQ